MGPNSKRNQQRNQLANQGPARARFSNWRPPSNKNNNKRNDRDNNQTVDKRRETTTTKNSKLNISLIEEKVLEIKKNDNNNEKKIPLPLHIENMIKQRIQIEKIELSSILTKQLTETLNLLIPNEIEDNDNDDLKHNDNDDIKHNNNEKNNEIIENYDIKYEDNIKISSSTNANRISLPSKHQTSTSMYEKEIIKKFECLGFFENEILQVLRNNKNNKIDDEDSIYIGLLMFVIKGSTFDLSTIENLDNHHEELLNQNYILREEEEVLVSIYDDSICIRHILLNDILCSIIDIAIDMNSSIRILIKNIDMYPSSFDCEFFGWCVNNNDDNSNNNIHHRTASLEGNNYIKMMRKNDNTIPLCFEFMQFVQSQPKQVIQSKCLQIQNISNDKVSDYEGNKITNVLEEEEKPVKPNPEVLRIPEYRNSLLAALNLGLTGDHAKAYALDQYKYLLPQRIIDEIHLEENRQEKERATAFDMTMFGLKGEIDCTKEIQCITDLTKAKAKSLIQSAVKQLQDDNDASSYNKSTLSKKVIDKAMQIYTMRLDKLEKKQEKMRGRKRGLTIRQAFEIVTETKNSSIYPRVNKFNEVESNNNNNDDDDDDYDDEDYDDIDSKEFQVNECLEKLRLQLNNRQETQNSKSIIDKSALSIELKRSLDKRRKSKRYKELLEQQNLPTLSMKEEIITVIKSHQITIIEGQTGCGKTTQIPQIILDDAIDNGIGGGTNIVVTQPRRISAISVAERIAAERMDPVGNTVGYHIRMEKKVSARTLLSLVTTGVLLRRLLADYKISDVTHLIVDEIHERDLNTDFLLIIIKILLQQRADLKVVLMSATINSQHFIDYFKDENCGVVRIPGRQFAVKMYLLEDAIEHTCFQLQSSTNNVCFTSKGSPDIKAARAKRSKALANLKNTHSAQTIKTLDNIDETILNVELIKMLVIRLVHQESTESNAFLIFASGIEAIRDIIDTLKNCQQLENAVILPLHSTLPSTEQAKVFNLYPNQIKIIVATNIAETSITIPDVTVVIDTGRFKENTFESKLSLSVLSEKWCSKANIAQRKGRAGRVREGTYYLLSSSVTYNDFEDYPTPEISRVSLEEVALQIMALQYGDPYDFLRCGVTVPSTNSIKKALDVLLDLEAITIVDDCAKITATGLALAAVPVNPRIALMLFYGVVLKVIDPILSIAALMNSKIFITSFENRDAADEARKSFLVGESDILTNFNAFTAYMKIKSKGYRKTIDFCRKNYLNYNNLLLVEQLRKQYLEILRELGMIADNLNLEALVDSMYNTNANNIDMICMAITKGCSSSIIKLPSQYDPSNLSLKLSEIEFFSKTIPLYIHPSCIQSDAKKISNKYLLYFDAGKTSKIYARDITPITSYISLILFGGPVKQYDNFITIDDWIVFEIAPLLANQLISLKGLIENMFISKILNKDDEVKNNIVLQLLTSLCKS